MWVVCSDLEGVFVPEVWVNVAKKTGIDALKLTTKDVKDYNELMTYRLKILKENNLTIKDIQNVISEINPLPGALEFVTWLRNVTRLCIVSDTFVEFADPLMKQLDHPFLLCHELEIDHNDMVAGYKLRQPDPKRKTVQAFKSLNYNVIAFGDSYNDVTMLEEAHVGILYCPPENVVKEFPQYPVARSFEELKPMLEKYIL